MLSFCFFFSFLFVCWWICLRLTVHLLFLNICQFGHLPIWRIPSTCRISGPQKSYNHPRAILLIKGTCEMYFFKKKSRHGNLRIKKNEQETNHIQKKLLATKVNRGNKSKNVFQQPTLKKLVMNLYEIIIGILVTMEIWTQESLWDFSQTFAGSFVNHISIRCSLSGK